MDTVPLFVGGLFFLGCLGATLVYGIVIAKGRARWGSLVIAVVGLLGLLPIAMVLPPLHPTLSSVSGTYEGIVGYGKDTLVLHPNGTFEQTYVTNNGKISTNRGTWKIDSSEGGGGVDFDHFLMPRDMTGTGQILEVTDFANAALHAVNVAIYFDEDADIHVTRTRR